MRKYFLAGLATLIPLAVTVYAVIFVVHLLTKPFMGIFTHLLGKLPFQAVGWITSDQIIRNISQLLILVLLVTFLALFGMLARWLLFKSFMKMGDEMLHKIPLFNQVYKTAKEIINTLFNSDKNTFKQVVLLKFPSRECYCIGLVSADAPKTCDEKTSSEMVSVFIPTTPNPMTGFLLMCPKSDLKYLKMSTEEAIKYVVSCAVILPQGNEEEMT